MSLIIYREKSLKEIAIIIFKIAKDKKVEILDKGDLKILKSGNEVFGINLFNPKKYISLEEGAHILTDEQFKKITSLAKLDLKNENHFSIGKIISRKPHPKSDKLFVLEVETDRKLQIVTNSLNSLENTFVVVANIGATLPSGMEIVLSKVMGVESQGMLCGAQTLGLAKESEGVLVLKKATKGNKFTF